MGMIQAGKNAIQRGKNAAKAVKSVVNKIKSIIKLLATPIGHILGIISLAISIIVLLYVILKTLEHAVGIFFNDDYAGISTTGDYDVLVGSLGYTGYDSFVTEELWQEYAAFEYEILMDVAEHIHEYQDYVTEIKYEGAGYDLGTKTTSAVFPEGIVSVEYDVSKLSEDKWQEFVVEGQKGNAPDEATMRKELSNIVGSSSTFKRVVGGNRNVTPPRLVYEVADHELETESVSLMPYIVIVREDLELNYFFNGLEKDVWDSYEDRNLKNIEPGDLENAQAELAPIRFSSELNRYNTNMPVSGYKKDLEDEQDKELVVGVEDKEGFVVADRTDKNGKLTGYGDEVYYTEEETNIVYKIPLKILINRYMPKSTLLTAWYMIKRDDPTGSGFEIDKLMADIKEVYYAACYQDTKLDIPAIKTTGKIDEETGKIDKNVPEVTLRAGTDDNFSSTTINDAIAFDEKGAIKRDENDLPIKESKTVKYATSNKRTFIYFEQFGLETTKYEYWVAYRGPSGDVEPNLPDEARPNEISPSARYLTRDKVNFIKQLNLTLPEVTYKYMDKGEVKEATIDLPVNLKPTYTLDSGLDEGDDGELIEEKLKTNYTFNSGITINQKAPYAFMTKVRQRFEQNSYLYESANNPMSGDEYIYKHNFMNKEYIIAEIGNTDKMDPIIEQVGKIGYETKDVEYRLPEDFKYYNQDDKMPAWFDFQDIDMQKNVEDDYLIAFKEEYGKGATNGIVEGNIDPLIEAMLLAEIPEAIEIVSYGTAVDYTYQESAKLYNGKVHVTKDEAKSVKDDLKYKINYYWEAVYVIEEKELQMKQQVNHVRMPALFVKYCDTWAKEVEYDNRITQNGIDYKDYRYLIPFAKTSLGFKSANLIERAHYRVTKYKDYFNKTEKDENTAIKEADVLDMLIQWEEYGNQGNEVSFAYMRDLYKLTLFIRKSGSMLENAYTFLYIPSTISNFDDQTTQKVFWLERLGVTQGEDELNEDEQTKTRTKGEEIHWQNLEYDEYYECITDTADGEDAKVYAMFPFGSPIIRVYYMLNDINDKNFIPNGFSGGHPATDIYARKFAKEILNRESDVAEHVYFYELNRLTLSYMRNGNRELDAFRLAEKALNASLEEQCLYSPIVSVAPGYVSEVGFDGRSGFYVKISHDVELKYDDYYDKYKVKGNPKITTRYDHMKRWPLVEVGDLVGAGTILGYEGTTGRSSGNHLHFEITNAASGEKADPHPYLAPLFTPFYYAEKAEEILEENKELALGSEYYTLERTLLLEDRLFNEYNVINDLKDEEGNEVTLEDGTAIDYVAPTNSTTPYKSGDSYEGGAYPNLIWGNNVPEQYIVKDVSEIMDLNLLNQTVPYAAESSDEGNGQNLKYSGSTDNITTNPEFFKADSTAVSDRLKIPKWYAVYLADYRIQNAARYYNGPRNKNAEITDEGFEDLKALQLSLKEHGYYSRAKVNFEEAGHGYFGDEFEKVVLTLQDDLIAKGYDKFKVTKNGQLDVPTISAYLTMIHFTDAETQYYMAEKAGYNSGVDISIEPALVWAFLVKEGGYGDKYLALKESDRTVSSKTLEYEYYVTEDKKYEMYTKEFNREEGLLQISPEIAVERYKEDRVEPEDAVIYVTSPMRNLNMGTEMLKEYAIELYDKYSGDIEKEKNKILFNNGGSSYWRDIFEECEEYETRWVDPENIDRLMVYAIALEAYYKEGADNVDAGTVRNIIQDAPTAYGQEVLNTFRELVLKEKA